jgi:hypothetical protein
MGREYNDTPGPFNFRGCDLAAEWLLAREHVRVRLPATAPISSQAARQLAPPSLQNSVRSGQHRGGLPVFRGRGRQGMHLPCKQAHAGALPADSTISLRGESDSGEPHKLSLRGCNSHPRYQFEVRGGKDEGRAAWPSHLAPPGEVIRLPACKSGVFKQAGSDDWSVTSTSHQFRIRSSISRATRCLREG